MPLELTVQPITERDMDEVLALHARAFGPGRFARTAYRIREGTPTTSPYCLVAHIGGELVASIRFTEITVGGKTGALLLGPLAVESRYNGLGYGKRLIADGIARAKEAGIEIVVLVGDEPYYSRFGFKRVPYGHIQLPGPVDPGRLLALELVEGALARYKGLVEAAR